MRGSRQFSAILGNSCEAILAGLGQPLLDTGQDRYGIFSTRSVVVRPMLWLQSSARGSYNTGGIDLKDMRLICGRGWIIVEGKETLLHVLN